MKKLYATLLTVGLSVPAFAIQTTPLDSKGAPLNDQYAGVSTCQIGSSTGTAALLCATGAGIILDIIGTSVTAANYVQFRDSATANTTSSELFRIDLAGLNRKIIYPRFKNGLSVNSSVTPGPGASGMWTIIYTQDVK